MIKAFLALNDRAEKKPGECESPGFIGSNESCPIPPVRPFGVEYEVILIRICKIQCKHMENLKIQNYNNNNNNNKSHQKVLTKEVLYRIEKQIIT